MTEVISEDQYGFLEHQAYCFAGLVLVPAKELRDAFYNFVERGQAAGIDFDEMGTGARDAVEQRIAGYFKYPPTSLTVGSSTTNCGIPWRNEAAEPTS